MLPPHAAPAGLCRAWPGPGVTLLSCPAAQQPTPSFPQSASAHCTPLLPAAPSRHSNLCLKHQQRHLLTLPPMTPALPASPADQHTRAPGQCLTPYAHQCQPPPCRPVRAGPLPLLCASLASPHHSSSAHQLFLKLTSSASPMSLACSCGGARCAEGARAQHRHVLQHLHCRSDTLPAHSGWESAVDGTAHSTPHTAAQSRTRQARCQLGCKQHHQPRHSAAATAAPSPTCACTEPKPVAVEAEGGLPA